MNRSSRRATTFAWTLMFALLLPILAACGSTATPPAGSAAASTAAPSAIASTAAPSQEASPSAEASEEASPSAEASASAAGGAEAQPSPINDKIFILGYNQSPETLFGLESNSSITGQVLYNLGLCWNNRSYAYQTTYCFQSNEFPTLENGGAVTETVQIDPASISVDNPIVVDGQLVTDTAEAEAAGIEIPSELDQLTLTWKLNPQLRWEDGTQVTSADVVESLRVLKDPQLNVASRYITERVISVDAPDAETAVQKMAPGYLDSDYYVSTWLGFVPAHIYGGKSIAEIREAESVKPVSFGPYMVQEHEPGTQTTLVSNPYFFQQPKIGTLVYKYVTEQDQLLAQLESGEIDYAGTIGLTLTQTPQLNDLESQGKIKTQFVPATVWEHIDYGIARGDGEPSFFDDVRVRQAVAYAINRQEIIDNVLFGRTTVMNTIVPKDHPSYPGDDALEPYAYNPDRAKQLLDEAGWTAGSDGTLSKDGRSFNISFYTTQGNATRQAVAEIIQQNLKQVGINVELQFVPATEVFFLDTEEGILTGRRFDLGMYAWVSGVDPFYDGYTCAGVPTPENNWSGQNYSGYCNPEYDAAQRTARAELDPEKRAELDAPVMTILNRDLPTFPLYQRVNVVAFNPAVTGIQIDPTSTYELYNIQDIDINK